MANCLKIGVVTVTFNSADVLPEFLQAMERQTHGEFVLFAIDNASKDQTMDQLHSCTDNRLRIIANEDNLGVAEGNNQGIRAALDAGCDLVLLLNNDTAFGETLFEELQAGLKQYKCDMVCPKIVYADEPQIIWAAGGTFQPWLGYRTRHFGEGKPDRGQYDLAQGVNYAPTCCVLIRREVFTRIGLMDPRYFVYVDDVDFMYRAMKAGRKMMYLPGSIVKHKVGYLTGGEESAFTTFYGTRNRVFFLTKNIGIIASIPVLAIYQGYYLASLLSRRFSLKKYRMKQRAFFSGLRVNKERLP
jgi:GT2 family glycosyltransferase